MKVSILMLAYNHEDYIGQALNSVLMQEVDFSYEIVVGEDCSSDATRRILSEFSKKYPDRIKTIMHPRNVGMHANFECVLDACSGEYVAILECDDYWTDINKLQKQVNFMECNNSLTECFHKVTTIYQDGRMAPHEFPLNLTRTKFYLIDVLSQFFIPTLSVLFRRAAIQKLPAEFYEVTNPDWLIHILCAEQGNIGFIDEVMGVYRVHAGGVWSGTNLNKTLENTIISAEVVNRYLGYRYEKVLDRRILLWHVSALKVCVKSLNFLHAIKHCVRFVNMVFLFTFRRITR